MFPLFDVLGAMLTVSSRHVCVLYLKQIRGKLSNVTWLMNCKLVCENNNLSPQDKLLRGWPKCILFCFSCLLC